MGGQPQQQDELEEDYGEESGEDEEYEQSAAPKVADVQQSAINKSQNLNKSSVSNQLQAQVPQKSEQ